MIRKSRRKFLASSLGMSFASGLVPALAEDSLKRKIEAASMAPLLHLENVPNPVIIQQIELLRKGKEFLVRVRSKDGVESVTVPNSWRMEIAYPVFLKKVAPFFLGKDAREIEGLLVDLYRHQSNYKLQGLLFWVAVAAVEMGILDLLGQVSGQSIGEMFGGVQRREIPVYRASGNRGNTPEAEVEHLKKLVAETGAQALKFRLGGRMSNNIDSLPGRTEALIPLVRNTFGPEMTLYADSNSSYDVPNAIRVGRLMEEYGYAFFEEPCPFDHLWETQEVTSALEIPIAGGEQEFSMRRFRWAILNRGVDIVQPDLHYFGGYLRCTRVARMAEAAGMDCTLHMSGSGLGYVNTLHFASYVPNCGAHQEFKGENNLPVECDTSDLRCKNGAVQVPTGPGLGVRIAPDFVAAAKPVSA